MVLYILKKNILTFSNTLENFISKEISALAKYSGDNGELWTADSERPSLTDPKVTLASTDHSFARGPARTCSAFTCLLYLQRSAANLRSQRSSQRSKGAEKRASALNVNLKDSMLGLNTHSNPREVGRAQKHNTEELGGGKVWKNQRTAQMGSWALRLRHCRAERPSSHPSNHAACF